MSSWSNVTRGAGGEGWKLPLLGGTGAGAETDRTAPWGRKGGREGEGRAERAPEASGHEKGPTGRGGVVVVMVGGGKMQSGETSAASEQNKKATRGTKNRQENGEARKLE